MAVLYVEFSTTSILLLLSHRVLRALYLLRPNSAVASTLVVVKAAVAIAHARVCVCVCVSVYILQVVPSISGVTTCDEKLSRLRRSSTGRFRFFASLFMCLFSHSGTFFALRRYRRYLPIRLIERKSVRHRPLTSVVRR